MSEFKVGDKVRVIRKIDEGLSCEVGTIATVIHILSPIAHYGEDDFNIHIDWETDSDWVNKSSSVPWHSTQKAGWIDFSGSRGLLG